MKKIIALLLAVLSLCAFTACGEPEAQDLTVYAPDGAPALAISKLISDNDNLGLGGTATYKVVSAQEIGPVMMQAKGDIIVMPVNAASKLYNKTEDVYKMAGVVTHGNLYIMSKTEIGLSDLKGKIIGVIGQGLVPDLTFKAILNKNGIEYQTSDEVIENKVAIRYFAAASDMLPLLKTGKLEIGLVPEPAATKLSKMSPDFKFRLDVQSLYSESGSYPQAVVMVKQSLLDKNPKLLDTLEEKITASVTYLNSNIEEMVNAVNAKLAEGVTPSLDANSISSEVVAGMKIYFESSESAKSSVIDYINDIIAVENSSAVAVGEQFFAK